MIFFSDFYNSVKLEIVFSWGRTSSRFRFFNVVLRSWIENWRVTYLRDWLIARLNCINNIIWAIETLCSVIFVIFFFLNRTRSSLFIKRIVILIRIITSRSSWFFSFYNWSRSWSWRWFWSWSWSNRSWNCLLNNLRLYFFIVLNLLLSIISPWIWNYLSSSMISRRFRFNFYLIKIGILIYLIYIIWIGFITIIAWANRWYSFIHE